MKDTGRTTCRMDRALRHGQMVQDMKEFIRTGKSTELEGTLGAMGRGMWANGLIIRSMEMASTPGSMEELMRALGKIIICTAKESTPGVMAVSMTASTTWTKSTGSGYISGQTEGAMKGTGRTESNMARVNICCRME
jgi:hypothetical protein